MTAVLAVVAGAAPPGLAQSLERRLSGAPDGNVTFHFASRPNICGDGRYFIRADGDMWYGSWNEGMRMSCERGPVRVLLVRDGRELLRIQTFAGPLAAEPNATDLGTVSTADAAAYLMRVAATVDGRPGRDALMPAMLADSVSVARELLALVRDQGRTREVRSSALSWLVRRRGERGAMSADEVSRTLATLARDESEYRGIRGEAVRSLARLETAEGLSAVVTMSQSESDWWLATEAVKALASSGDPRARQHLRAAAERTQVSEEARAAAINGLAGSYATSRDADFLRSLYRRVTSDRLRDAVMNGVAQIGGSESRSWLIAIAKDVNEPVRQRKMAITHADRMGMVAADLSQLYDAIDSDEVRASVIQELSQLGTRAASDKLISIAKNDPSVANRRRAIQALGRFDDPRVREALKELVSVPR
jgi:HEAT repeat protein